MGQLPIPRTPSPVGRTHRPLVDLNSLFARGKVSERRFHNHAVCHSQRAELRVLCHAVRMDSLGLGAGLVEAAQQAIDHRAKGLLPGYKV